MQAHFPDEQVVPLPQTAQAAPPVPQVGLLDVWHLPFVSQQPLGQELALQTHLPPLQAWPVAQGAQVAPLLPQVPMLSALCRTQVVPLQQPPLQELAVQAQAPVAPQAWPVAQATQAAPPVPQVVVPEVWHWPFLSQQPLGQEAASQTHCPCALHSCWLPQGTQAPPILRRPPVFLKFWQCCTPLPQCHLSSPYGECWRASG